MIVDFDIKPDRQIYFLGAVLMDILGRRGERPMGVYDLHEAFRARTSMGAEPFFLALDWLYLLGVVDACEGGVRRCS